MSNEEKEHYMKLTEEQRKEFEAVSRPMIKWINDNCHPHVVVSVEATHSELSEGICAFVTDDYILD